MSATHEKHLSIFEVFKPRCVKGMEDALKRLEFAADRTINLVKENGHALEKAATPEEKEGCCYERSENQNN